MWRKQNSKRIICFVCDSKNLRELMSFLFGNFLWCCIERLLMSDAQSIEMILFLVSNSQKKIWYFEDIFFCSSYELKILRWCHGQKKPYCLIFSLTVYKKNGDLSLSFILTTTHIRGKETLYKGGGVYVMYRLFHITQSIVINVFLFE